MSSRTGAQLIIQHENLCSRYQITLKEKKETTLVLKRTFVRGGACTVSRDEKASINSINNLRYEAGMHRISPRRPLRRHFLDAAGVVCSRTPRNTLQCGRGQADETTPQNPDAMLYCTTKHTRKKKNACRTPAPFRRSQGRPC